jgi:hypothetical protein
MKVKFNQKNGNAFFLDLSYSDTLKTIITVVNPTSSKEQRKLYNFSDFLSDPTREVDHSHYQKQINSNNSIEYQEV